jgi:NADPH2:quinone reductase
MHAIRVSRFGDPAVMQYETVDPPELTRDHQVIVRLHAAGVNPVDTYIRSGQYSRQPDLPYTPGIDGAGQVVAVGAGVKSLQVGDPVYGGWPLTGTYAEFALYEEPWVFPRPDHITAEQGAGIFVPYSTAYRALFHKGQAQPGDKVLIHGATGSVGLAAVQLAVAQGLTVIGTGGSVAGRALAQAQGATLVLDHHQSDYGDAILEATSGQGVDVVLEMLANVNLGRDLSLIAPKGRIVVIGNRGEIAINPRDIMAGEAILTGMSLFNTPAQDLQRMQQHFMAGLRNGSLCPVVYQSLPLSSAPEAHQEIMSSPAQGNWVLLP